MFKDRSGRAATPDKLDQLNRKVYPRTTQFSLRQPVDPIPDSPLITESSQHLPMRSIIKKQSAIKPSHEILSQSKKGRESVRKVQFEDLMYVDDVDEYIRAEEKSYHKVTKKNVKPKNVSSAELDLAKKDGLDQNSILTKRRRSEMRSEEEDSETRVRKHERSSSSEAEPEPKRKKHMHIIEIDDEPKPAKIEKTDKNEPKIKHSMPEQLKGTMAPEAEQKYHAMIASLFGPSKRL